MIKAYKYRIYPTGTATGSQSVVGRVSLVVQPLLLIAKMLGSRNKTSWLARNQEIDSIYKKSNRPTLSQVYSQVLQNVTERVDLAFKSFFRRLSRRTRYPRFKSYGRYDSMTYAQSGFKVDGEWLDLSKVKIVDGVAPSDWRNNQNLTIRRSSTQ